MNGQSSLHALSGEVFSEGIAKVFSTLIRPQCEGNGTVLCAGPGLEAEVCFKGPTLVGEQGQFHVPCFVIHEADIIYFASEGLDW